VKEKFRNLKKMIGKERISERHLLDKIKEKMKYYLINDKMKQKAVSK